MNMNVTESSDGVTHVALDGRFDIEGAQQVDGPITDLAKRAGIIIIDVSKVTFIASLGVRTLMTSAKTIIGRGAHMAVCGATEGVEKVLRLTGLDEVCGLYADYASAAASLTARAKEYESRKPS
jgi:anti-sigma B factor antagonist